jgi:hypothetical protein
VEPTGKKRLGGPYHHGEVGQRRPEANGSISTPAREPPDINAVVIAGWFLRRLGNDQPFIEAVLSAGARDFPLAVTSRDPESLGAELPP